MTKDKSFFVNVKKEDTSMLKTKLIWIIDELESRIIKARDFPEKNIVRAISKPMRYEMSKSEILKNIKRWHENSTLKIHMCLKFLQKNDWIVNKSNFLGFCKNELEIKKPELFLLSLTKKPHIREWTNIEDQRRKSRDYGDILKSDNGRVILNPKYEREIKKIWSD